MTPVLVRHEPGCRWARIGASAQTDAEGQIIASIAGGGHSDAAKRFSDWFNLHKSAGTARGWIAVALADGASDGEVYDSRAQAVRFMHPNERWFFYATLSAAPSLSVCAADSLLRTKRVMSEVEGGHTDRDAPHGGLEVIPRLTMADVENQIRAVRSGRGLLALGYRKG